MKTENYEEIDFFIHIVSDGDVRDGGTLEEHTDEGDAT